MACIAVIPARRAERTIVATLASLRIGNAPFVRGVLVVTSQGDPTAELVNRWSARDGRVRCVTADCELSAGAARNLGRAAAARWMAEQQAFCGDGIAAVRDLRREQGGLARSDDDGIAPHGRENVSRPDADGRSADEVLLFVDADCSLEAGGAERLARELRLAGGAAIAARVLCGGGWIARSRHLLEFKEAASERVPPEAWLPPSTTLLCRGDAFDRVGGFVDLWPGEDLVFSQTLRDLGELVCRSEQVVTHHAHPKGLGTMLVHQWRLGRTAARARGMRSMPGSFFARSRPLAALLFPARSVRLLIWQAREGWRGMAEFLLLLPLLLGGLMVWTAGFVAGVDPRPR